MFNIDDPSITPQYIDNLQQVYPFEPVMLGCRVPIMSWQVRQCPTQIFSKPMNMHYSTTFIERLCQISSSASSWASTFIPHVAPATQWLQFSSNSLHASIPPLHLFFVSTCLFPKVRIWWWNDHSSPPKSTKSTKDHLASPKTLNQVYCHTKLTTKPPCAIFCPKFPKCSSCLPWRPFKVSTSSSLSPLMFVKSGPCRQTLTTMFSRLFYYFGLST